MPSQLEVVAVKNAVERELFRLSGVTAVDVNYRAVNGRRTDELAIVVWVRRKKYVHASERIPSTILGIKTDVVEGEVFVDDPRLGSGGANEVDAEGVAQPAVDPLVGGISVGSCAREDTGTLGVVLKVNSQVQMLSNYHVLASGISPKQGDLITQPGRADGGTCPGTIAGAYNTGFLGQPRNVDAALGLVKDRKSALDKILSIGTLTGSATAKVGDKVRKYGSTSQLTTGTVVSVNLSCSIDYPVFGMQKFLDQIKIENDIPNKPFQSEGDSGAVLVNADNKIVGLMFGAPKAGKGTYGVANTYQDVQHALGLPID